MAQQGQSTDSDEVETVQKSVTLKEPTLKQLEEAYPHALDDADRLRQAVGDAIELKGASAYQVTRDDDG